MERFHFVARHQAIADRQRDPVWSWSFDPLCRLFGKKTGCAPSGLRLRRLMCGKSVTFHSPVLGILGLRPTSFEFK
jgi:hypothetical protein